MIKVDISKIVSSKNTYFIELKHIETSKCLIDFYIICQSIRGYELSYQSVSPRTLVSRRLKCQEDIHFCGGECEDTAEAPIFQKRN